MSATATSAQAPAPPFAAFLTHRHVWQVCYLASRYWAAIRAGSVTA